MKHNHNFDHTTQSGIFVQTFRTVLRRHSLLTFGMVFFIICSVMLALVPPLILEQLINCLTAGNAVRLSLILLYFVVLSVSGLSEAVQNVLITVFGQKITHTFRRQMCHKLSRLPASYFTANEPGKITSRFVNDVDAVDALFTNGVVSMFADCCKVLSIFVVIFWKSKGLGILMLLLIPFCSCSPVLSRNVCCGHRPPTGQPWKESITTFPRPSATSA